MSYQTRNRLLSSCTHGRSRNGTCGRTCSSSFLHDCVSVGSMARDTPRRPATNDVRRQVAYTAHGIHWASGKCSVLLATTASVPWSPVRVLRSFLRGFSRHSDTDLLLDGVGVERVPRSASVLREQQYFPVSCKKPRVRRVGWASTVHLSFVGDPGGFSTSLSAGAAVCAVQRDDRGCSAGGRGSMEPVAVHPYRSRVSFRIFHQERRQVESPSTGRVYSV